MTDETPEKVVVDLAIVTPQEIDAALSAGAEITWDRRPLTARTVLAFEYVEAARRELRVRRSLAEAEASMAQLQAEASTVHTYRAELAHGISRLDYDDTVRTP